jgi:hypothetical protein
MTQWSVCARRSDGNGASVGLPTAVNTSGDQTLLRFLLGTVIVRMRTSYRHMTTGPTIQ